MFQNMRPDLNCIPDRCWEELSQNLLPEKAILHTRTTRDQLKQVYQDGYAVIDFRDDHIVGFFAAWPVSDEFCEVGTVWVHKDLRGHGIGHALYLALGHLLRNQHRMIFGLTTNPISVHLGQYLNLESCLNWSYPIPWELTCGRCDYLTEADKPSCSKRDKTCWLRVMKK